MRSGFALAVGLTLLLAARVAEAAPLPDGSAPPARANEAPASFIRAEDYRVARIGFRIGLAGVGYCPEPYPLSGLGLHHLLEYEPRDRAEAAQSYGLDRGPAILSVIEDSPAARAGLRAGDIVVAVNGASLASPSPLADEREGTAARLAVEAVEGRLEEALRAGPARLTLLRDDQEMTTVLESVPGCPARVRLARSGQLNAFANRGYAIMTTALLDFTRSDEEVAMILGHEIAHNILRHPDMLEAEGVPNGILRGFGKNAAKVRATEEEADRLGLRLAAAAGYDMAAAIPYWRRYYARRGPSLPIFRTHPGLKAREALVSAVLTELRAERSHQRPQAPQFREGALGER